MTIEHQTERACPLCMGSVAVADTVLRVVCPHCGLEFPVRRSNPDPPKPREEERGACGEIRLAAWLRDEPYEFEAKAAAVSERSLPSPTEPPRPPSSSIFARRIIRAGSVTAALFAVVAGGVFAFQWIGVHLPVQENSEDIVQDVAQAEPAEVSNTILQEPMEAGPVERTASPEEEACEEPIALGPAESPVWLLSAMAERRLASDPKASLVFATEAARRALAKKGQIDPSVEQTLRDAIGAVRDAGLRFPEASLELLALTPDGRWLAAGGDGKNLYAWDLHRLRETHEPFVLAGHRQTLTALAADPAGHAFASGDAGGNLLLWNLDRNDPTEPPQLHALFADAVQHAAFSADGGRLVAVGKEEGLSVAKWIDLASPSPTARGLERLSEEVACVAVDPKGEWVALAGEGRRIHVYRLQNQPPTRKRILSGHEGGVVWLQALGDGARLVSGGADGTVCLWDLRRPKGTEPIRFRHGDGIRKVAVSRGDAWIAALAADRTVCLWNLGATDPEEHGILLPRQPEVKSIAFTEDGNSLVTAGEDGSIQLWRLSETEPIDHPIVLRGSGRGTAALTAAARGWIVAASEGKEPQEPPRLLFCDTDQTGLLRTAQTLLDKEVPSASRERLLAEISGPTVTR